MLSAGEFITFRWEYKGASFVVTLRWPSPSEWSQYHHQSNRVDGNQSTDALIDARLALANAVLFDVEGYTVKGNGRDIVLGRGCLLSEEELSALSQERGFQVMSWKDLVPFHWRLRWMNCIDKEFLEGQAVPLEV